MKSYLMCAALGALSVLAFAPFEIYPLIFVLLAGLIHIVFRWSPKRAALGGFCFGLGQYLFGISWVYVSLSTYGGMPLWMGSIAVIGFAALVAVFIGLAMWLAAAIAKRANVSFLLVVPFSWVVLEWCKSWVLTGFPWLDVGYTQTPSWLMGWAPVGGIYLVSFVVLAIAAALVWLWQQRSVFAVVTIATLIGSSFFLNSIAWTRADGRPLTVGIVQANIAIESKWLEQTRRKTIEQYRDLSHVMADSQPKFDLVVWPETALPLYASQTDRAFWQAMSPMETAVVAGLLDHDGENSYNAAALSCPERRAEPQIYRKRHLVPFGEYQPLKFLFGWVFEYLQLPMSDFAGWQGQQPLRCEGNIDIALSICYEDAFSNEYRQHLGSASVLVNISEDAWFGDSFAPHQRTQFAQMRARELGRPLVRAANSGPSLFINEFGELLVNTEQFEVATAHASIQPMTGYTPFIRWGSWIIWLAMLVLMLALSAVVVSSMRRKPS